MYLGIFVILNKFVCGLICSCPEGCTIINIKIKTLFEKKHCFWWVKSAPLLFWPNSTKCTGLLSMYDGQNHAMIVHILYHITNYKVSPSGSTDDLFMALALQAQITFSRLQAATFQYDRDHNDLEVTQRLLVARGQHIICHPGPNADGINGCVPAKLTQYQPPSMWLIAQSVLN